MLDGKVAVVTGAGSGMGKEISKLYAKNGAKVLLSDVNENSIKDVCDEISADGGIAQYLICDVSKADQVEALIKEAVSSFGSVDIMVNNAGIMDNFVPVSDLEDGFWDKVLSINLNGVMYGCRAAIREFMSKNTKGVIVNIASVGGLFGARGGAAYVTSKHAVLGLTKNIASVYGEMGIRCNAIAPGSIKTNIGATITAPNELGLKSIQETYPAPDGEATDIADAALFLASDYAGFVNGTTIVVDGGWTAR